jgi:hypothetical protein
MTQGVRDSAAPPPYERALGLDSRPSAEEQIQFLANIERLLADGSFVATYKYALLIVLIDLAVEHGDDTRAELPLCISEIAERFAELYWRQSAPYVADGDGSGILLHQNKGKQAKAIRLLAELRKRATTLATARQGPHWRPLASEMRTLLQTMPLWKLQRIGHEYVEFLYHRGPDTGWITLLPGVASHLRQRGALIRRLAQTEWLKFVLTLKQNQAALGSATGLSEFLFGTKRAALSLKLTGPLSELGGGRCFYCGHALARQSAIDHFIPWSTYPRDLVHNLVVAHAKCNALKSNLLGGEDHLQQWTRSVTDNDEALAEIGQSVGVVVDRPASIAVAKWSYARAEQNHAEVWLGGDRYGHLSSSWNECFLVAGPISPRSRCPPSDESSP